MRTRFKLLLAALAVGFAGQTPAAGTVTFAKVPASDKQVHVPGLSLVVAEPVSPEEAERAIWARTVGPVNKGIRVSAPSTSKGGSSAMRVNGDTSAAAPASIPELARALKNDVDLIYAYVRNNIEYIPTWGMQKGHFGTLLDNHGTSFDQAALMIALLRQSGYTASFVKGRINVTGAQLQEWMGVDATKACGALQLVAQARIPYSAAAVSSTSLSCPGGTASLLSVKLEHVWVKVVIGGTPYYFDPSYKPHTETAPINLATATGYNSATYLSTATSGATVTADYAQGINRAGIRSGLTGYANSLATYLRTNHPAATLDTVIGGRTITPFTAASLRQTSLPNQDTAVALTEWATDVPVNYKNTLRVVYQGIDQTYTSDAIYGKRFTITYNASGQPLLSLDGALVATGTAIAAGTYANVAITASHGAFSTTTSNQAFNQSIKAGGTFLISNGWGVGGRGMVDFHRNRLEEARASGAAPESEAVMGSTLAVVAASWIGQVDQSGYMNDRLARTITLPHHRVGIAGYNNGAYVDLPGNIASVVSIDANATKEKAVFLSGAMHMSVLESVAIHQATGGSAVSTVKLIDAAVAANLRIYDARSANFASAVQPNLVGCASTMPSLQSALAAGARLILPSRCDLNEGSWTGTAFFSDYPNGGLGSIISGGLAGGFATSPLSALDTSSNTVSKTKSTTTLTQNGGTFWGDPIDMTKGHFLYQHDDITVGTGSFPMSLSFARSYSSGNRTQDETLGRGWTHNFASNAGVSSDGFQGMGEDSGLDAVGAITEKLVALDVLGDGTRSLRNMIIATIGQRWYSDQITNNTVIVKQGVNGEVFVKLPDGSYNAPPGNSTKLILNVDGTFSTETLNKAVLTYNAAGRLATYTHPSGLQAKFTYSGNDLSQVTNSVGRSLTLTYTGGRVSSVFDGLRTVRYTYDASGNQVTYTNASGKVSTYQYDLPGRMTKFFYPANPTIAMATNVYDSLGRVQTQTNANGKLYNYYFAGSRSEEAGPLGRNLVSYLDADGKVLKAIDALGRATLNTYDGQLRLTRTQFPGGNQTEYVYDDAPCATQLRCTHNVKTIRRIPKAGSGLPTLSDSFTYDSSFNAVATSTDSMSNTSTFTYTAQGAPATATRPADAEGNQPLTTYGYTAYTISGFPALYLQTAVTEKISATKSVLTNTAYSTASNFVQSTTSKDAAAGGLAIWTAYAHDMVGNVTRVLGSRSDVTDAVDMVYDSERRLVQTTNALGKISKQFYDADGRLIRSSSQIGSNWLVSCASFSPVGDVLKTWGPFEQAIDTSCPVAAAPISVTDYAYDDLERNVRITKNLSLADGGNRVSETSYFLNGAVQSQRRAVGTTAVQIYTTNTYGLNDELLTVKDAKDQLTTFEYDGHFRKIKTRFPEKTLANVSSTTDVERYGFNENSLLTSLVNRSGDTVTITYDNLGRPVNRTYPNSADNVAIAYDLMSRPTLTRYVNGSFDVASTYDNVGRLLSTTAGTKTLSHIYDRAGNVVRTTWPEATPFYVTTSYDALNRPTEIKEMGNVPLATYAYDDQSRRTTVTLGNGTTTSYAYSTEYSLSALGHDLAGTGTDNNLSFARNQVQEIKSHSWTNDLYQWKNGINGTSSYIVNGLNQYASVAGAAMSHDSNGNISSDGVWTYGYDFENRLKSASKSGVAATLSYDAVGRLRQTVIGTTTTNLVYSGVDLVAEYDAAGSLLRRYVHGPGTDEALVQYSGAATLAKTWLYRDHMGSVIATADSAGTSTATYSYGPFGEPSVGPASRFRYTGQQYIAELDLHYYKARFYSSSLGRFLQVDPIGYLDDLNAYAYVSNNPINASDPSGLAKVAGSAVIDTLKAIGNTAVNTVEAGVNLFSGALPGARDYLPFMDGLRTGYDNPVFGQTLEFLLPIKAMRSTSGGAAPAEGGPMFSICFVAGTPIQTATGAKNIEDIQVGDTVLAFHTATQSLVNRPVVRLFHNRDRHIIRVTVGGESGRTEEFGATPEHPFWVDGEGWVPAEQLQSGDVVRNLDREVWRVLSVIDIKERADTYNFEVADDHNYFIGKRGVLVHNQSKLNGDNPAAKRGREAHKNYENTLGGGDYEFNKALPSGKRPDAVNYSTNTVRELKPDTSSTIRKGLKQLDRYAKELETITGQAWTKIMDTYKK